MGHLNLWEKTIAFANMIKLVATWKLRNTHYRYTVEGNPKFMGPRDAVKLIQDGDVCMVAGLAGNQRISILAWAIQDMFLETGHPKNLTLISMGGQGGRGKAPGTLEELGYEGLVTRFFSAHHETYKSLLKLADEGKLELQCLPQGIIALLIDAQTRGEDSIVSTTGIGTFCDPRVGTGSAPFDENAEQFITVEEDKLKYRLPKINVALFNAPAADKEGNIYVDNCATVSETREAALAARKNGGKVIANVGYIVEKDESKIFLKADQVDAVVQYYKTEQTCGFLHSKPLEFFCANSGADSGKGMDLVRFINQVMGITPRRNKLQKAIARLAASVITQSIPRGAYMNIGTGLPEEVGQVFHSEGIVDNKYTLFTEAGAIGGMPAPGIFFGAAITPQKIISSPETFRMVYKNLDATILGFLQVDQNGNVNASKKGDGVTKFVGPGGFIDFTCTAKNIFFIGSWMIGGKEVLNKNIVQIAKKGRPKFVEKVDEVTFNGEEALKANKNVYFFTTVGAFQWTSEGMKLISVMPGIDIKKDILDFARINILVAKDIPTVDSSIITGKGYRLSE